MSKMFSVEGHEMWLDRFIMSELSRDVQRLETSRIVLQWDKFHRDLGPT